MVYSVYVTKANGMGRLIGKFDTREKAEKCARKHECSFVVERKNS